MKVGLHLQQPSWQKYSPLSAFRDHTYSFCLKSTSALLIASLINTKRLATPPSNTQLTCISKCATFRMQQMQLLSPYPTRLASSMSLITYRVSLEFHWNLLKPLVAVCTIQWFFFFFTRHISHESLGPIQTLNFVTDVQYFKLFILKSI
jgi:hypothetical protein